MRPLQTLPGAGVDLAAVAREDLTPVHHVVKFRSPRLPYVIATVLGLAAIALALIGLGSTQRSDVPQGLLTVSGVDPAAATPIEVDMTKPIPVAVTGAQGDAVTLALSVLDTPVGRRVAPLTPGAHGSVAMLPPPVSPYLIAGRMTGALQVLRAGKVVATYRLALHSTQSALTTALAAATVLVGLFGFAYTESHLRTLRRGKSRVTAVVGLALSCAVLGVAATAAAWVLMGHQPTPATLVGSSALAAGAGLAAAVGALWGAPAHRYRQDRRARDSVRPVGIR
jgi:hypothetical protein